MGSTPSSGTGPEGDHTCNQPKAGHFMYIEASVKAPRQKAIMYSPKYRGFKELCVGFHYHMFGRHVGTLNVYTKVCLLNKFSSNAIYVSYDLVGSLNCSLYGVVEIRH